MEENQIQMEGEAQAQSVPWSLFDTWLGVGLLVLVNIGLLAALFVFQENAQQLAQNAGILLAEFVYLLPVILILGVRRIHWRHLGFGGFSMNTLGLGCGLLMAAYGLILLHNAALYYLGVDTQGEQILKIFSELESPIWFVLVAVVLAPLVEEIFFRGFLFQGFRQRYGWKGGVLLSSFIFGAAHLDPVAFLPTFVLGAVIAYIYHRSNSLWPGIILHVLVNALGVCGAYAATHLPGVIPT
jgi:membrane protease YdiL (CAAX protease family)